MTAERFDIVGHFASLLARGVKLSRAADKSAVCESPQLLAVLKEAATLWDDLQHRPLSEMVGFVNDDQSGRTCALALVGCLLHVVVETLRRASGLGVDAKVGLFGLVAKCNGATVYQLLHSHGFGTAALSLAKGIRAYGQYASGKEGHLEQNSMEMFSALAEVVAHAAAPGDTLPCSQPVPRGVCGKILNYVKAADKAAKPHQQLDIFIKIGWLFSNVFQVGSRCAKIQALGQCVGVVVMDLVGTGALHDLEIPLWDRGVDHESTAYLEAFTCCLGP